MVRLGQSSSEQALELLCQNAQKNLDSYFDSVGQSVDMVASYAEADLETEGGDLQAHVDKMDVFFGKVARQTNGVLTYYYRLDPSVSDDVTGFWYVDSNGNGFVEHEVTDNLGARVVSYNVPIFRHDQFIGVIGIEIEYATMANQVDNIKLYDSGYAFLNDDKGNIIYHPYIDVLTLPKDQIPKTPDELKGYESLSRYTYNGVRKEAYRQG